MSDTTQIPKQAPKGKQIAAAVIGNALEWYDFLVFVFLLDVISPLFFPIDENGSATQSFLKGALVFGAGFVMRPIGGIVFGMIADRLGRRKAMIMITSLMAISILMVTVTPTYATIGIGAPIILVLARLIQGFSSGGEFGSSTALLIEMAPAHRKTYFGSWQMTGQMMALFLGGAAGYFLFKVFTPEQISSWAWRIPFAFGLLIIPVAAYIRRHLEETEEFLEVKEKRAKQAKAPAQVQENTNLAMYSLQAFVCLLLVVCLTISIYITFTYVKTFATTQLGLTAIQGSITQMVAAGAMVLVIPLFGIIADRYNRRTLLVLSLLCYLILVYPIHVWLLQAPSLTRLIIAQLALVPFVGMFFAVFSTITAELFPTKIRSLGLSVTYNIAVMLFGGFATYFVSLITEKTQDPLSGVYYIMFGTLIGLIGALSLVLFVPQPKTGNDAE